MRQRRIGEDALERRGARREACQPAYESTSIQPQHSVAYGIRSWPDAGWRMHGRVQSPPTSSQLMVVAHPDRDATRRIDRLRAVAFAGSQRGPSSHPPRSRLSTKPASSSCGSGSHQLRGAHARIRINCHSVVSFKQLSETLDASEPEWMDRFDHLAKALGSNANNRMMKMTSGRRVTFMRRAVGSPPNASPRRGGGSSPDGTAQ